MDSRRNVVYWTGPGEYTPSLEIDPRTGRKVWKMEANPIAGIRLISPLHASYLGMVIIVDPSKGPKQNARLLEEMGW